MFCLWSLSCWISCLAACHVIKWICFCLKSGLNLLRQTMCGSSIAGWIRPAVLWTVHWRSHYEDTYYTWWVMTNSSKAECWYKLTAHFVCLRAYRQHAHTHTHTRIDNTQPDISDQWNYFKKMCSSSYIQSLCYVSTFDCQIIWCSFQTRSHLVLVIYLVTFRFRRTQASTLLLHYLEEDTILPITPCGKE